MRMGGGGNRVVGGKDRLMNERSGYCVCWSHSCRDVKERDEETKSAVTAGCDVFLSFCGMTSFGMDDLGTHWNRHCRHNTRIETKIY